MNIKQYFSNRTNLIKLIKSNKKTKNFLFSSVESKENKENTVKKVKNEEIKDILNKQRLLKIQDEIIFDKNIEKVLVKTDQKGFRLTANKSNFLNPYSVQKEEDYLLNYYNEKLNDYNKSKSQSKPQSLTESINDDNINKLIHQKEEPSTSTDKDNKLNSSFSNEITEENYIKLNLKALSELDFPIVLYESNSEDIRKYKLFDLITKASSVLFLFTNIKLLLTEAIFKAWIVDSLFTFIGFSTYMFITIHKEVIQMNVMEMIVNPKQKTISLLIFDSWFKFPTYIIVPINKIQFFRPEFKSQNYYFRIKDSRRYENKVFVLLINGRMYQESLLKELYKI